MNVRYQEWLCGLPRLRGIVTAYWQVTGDGVAVPSSAILPDGHVELVLNMGEPVDLAGPAYTGGQPERAIVGPLSQAIRLKYRGMVNTFGVRFHPACGAAFFGQRATALTGKLLRVEEVCPDLDRALIDLLAAHPNLDTEAARAALDRVLVQQLAFALPADDDIVASVDRLAAAERLPSVAQIARELGISARQFQRRFRAAAGLSPKEFVRVLRFARVWQVASMRPDEPWAKLAADYGYSDQAHLVREFRDFGADPPTRVFTEDWYGATTLSRVAGPAGGVRSVQDSGSKPRL